LRSKKVREFLTVHNLGSGLVLISMNDPLRLVISSFIMLFFCCAHCASVLSIANVSLFVNESSFLLFTSFSNLWIMHISYRSLPSSSSVSMKYMQNIALYLLHANFLPFVHGRVRFASSSGETTNEDAMVLMSAPHLNSNGDGNKNHGPMPRDQHHRHVQAEPDWTQMGDDIIGDTPGDFLGFSVAMSSDGKRIAAGAPTASDTGGT
jgi:hypothetical protein